jgi:hypothetical protein
MFVYDMGIVGPGPTFLGNMEDCDRMYTQCQTRSSSNPGACFAAVEVCKLRHEFVKAVRDFEEKQSVHHCGTRVKQPTDPRKKSSSV